MSVYAFADIHGNYNLFKQIKDFLQPDDICYVLGDCCDRGPDGYEIIKEVIDDKRFIYLKGNHEDLFYDSMRMYDFGRRTCSKIHFNNGGFDTYDKWHFEMEKHPDEAERVKDIIKNLPLYAEYTNTKGQIIKMNHAGFEGKSRKADDYLWDRNDIFETKWYWDKNEFLVHGHTPIQYITNKTEVYKPYWYCENHKVDLDCCTILTKKIFLLNLDTFEYITFKEKE